MSHKVNLVRVFTAATGTSTPITLGAAYSQLFMTPAEAGAMDGRVYTYLIVDGNDWEMGRGAYTASGTSLARTTIIASRISGTLGTSRITLTGTAQVRFIEAAEDMDGVRGTRAVTGTSDVLANSDQGYVVTYNNGGAIAVSLAQAGASNLFLSGWATTVQNIGAGTVTITPAASTINASATLTLASGMGAFIWSDGTNYRAFFIPASKPLLGKDNLIGITDTETAQVNLGATSVGKSLFTAATVADAHRAVQQSARVITSSDTIVASDIGKTLIFNSTSAFTVAITAAATLGNGFWCRFKNVNVGVVTLDPNSSEVIDTLTTSIVPKFDSGLLVCDGSAFYTLDRPSLIVLGSGNFSSTSLLSLTLPAGFAEFEINLADVIPSVSNVILGRVSIDAGSTFETGYNTSWWYNGPQTTTLVVGGLTADSYLRVPSTINTGNPGGAVKMTLQNATSAASYFKMFGVAQSQHSSGNQQMLYFQNWLNNKVACNLLQFFPDSGAWNSGSWQFLAKRKMN